jgi:hypothetical protein
MFEKALKRHLKFSTDKGILTTEDLMDLPVESLDKIAIALNKEIKEGTNESFLKPTRVSPDLSLKFEVVKYILEDKVKEAEIKAKKAIRKAEILKIQALINQKKDEEFAQASIADLQGRLNELLDSED